jgi:MoxR-like ATPase
MESEGVHPLSDSQRDHFMFCVEWSAIPNGPRVVIDLTASPARSMEKVLAVKQLLQLQRVIRELTVSDHVMKYAVRVVRATRPTDKRAPETIRKHVHAGAGPRAVQNLVQAAKARAVLDGRLLVEVADARAMAIPALAHRLCASFSAGAEGWNSRAILEKLLAEVDARDVAEA